MVPFVKVVQLWIVFKFQYKIKSENLVKFKNYFSCLINIKYSIWFVFVNWPIWLFTLKQIKQY